MSHVKTQFNLPPIARRQTQPIEFDKIEQFVYQSPLLIKQKRTQSMYSLETMDLKTKQRTKVSPRKNIKDAYNKWYVPPKKRFLDLRKESEEFLQEQYIINTYAQQQVKYSQILRESKQLAQFVEQVILSLMLVLKVVQAQPYFHTLILKFLYQLLRARIAYFLGNYSKVLEIWQQNDADDDYFYFLVSRALIASRELKPKTIPLTKKPSQKLLEITDIVSRLMGPLIKQQKSDTTIDEDRKQIEDVLKKLKDMIPQQNQKIIQIICAYLSVNSCEAQYALNLEMPKDAFLQELRFLQLMIYLRGRRLDLAEQTLLELKRIDDEDILSYLGDIYSNIYNGFPDQALKNIQEAKDRFGDSAKLMNLMISCLINQNKFEEAFELGQKVKNIIVEREQFSDRQEIETCLSNLIVLSEIQGKHQQKDECLQILEQVNKSCHFLKRYAEKISKIESLQ